MQKVQNKILEIVSKVTGNLKNSIKDFNSIIFTVVILWAFKTKKKSRLTNPKLNLRSFKVVKTWSKSELNWVRLELDWYYSKLNLIRFVNILYEGAQFLVREKYILYEGAQLIIETAIMKQFTSHNIFIILIVDIIFGEKVIIVTNLLTQTLYLTFTIIVKPKKVIVILQ